MCDIKITIGQNKWLMTSLCAAAIQQFVAVVDVIYILIIKNYTAYG